MEKKPGVRSLGKSPENKTPFPGGFCTNNRVVKTEAVKMAIQMKSNSCLKFSRGLFLNNPVNCLSHKIP